MELNATTVGYGFVKMIFMAAGVMVFVSTLATQWAAGGAMDAMIFVWYLISFIIIGIGKMLWWKGSHCCETPAKK